MNEWMNSNDEKMQFECSIFSDKLSTFLSFTIITTTTTKNIIHNSHWMNEWFEYLLQIFHFIIVEMIDHHASIDDD